ncbi:MAG TPA: S9 family peptidase [Steroidobacteraceae bacterium]
MRMSCLLATLLLLAAGTTLAEDARPFTVDDLVRLDRVSDPQVSPDGRYVVFTVRETDFDANKGRTDLWLLDLDAEKPEPRRLTQHEANDSNGRWSPDGASIYFTSTRSGSSQVWRLTLAGGEAMQVTRYPVDVNAFKVAPRGSRLLVSIEVFADCADLECTAKRLEQNEKSLAKGHTHDRLFVRHWDTWKDGRIAQLFSIGLDAEGNVQGAPVRLTARLDADVPSKPFGGDEEFNFSPDGTRVAFAARIKGKDEPWSTNFDVYETTADGGGEPRNLTASNPAWDTQPSYSSDGRSLAWIAMDRPKFEADRFHLVLMDLKSGNVRRVTEDWDRSIDRFAFSGDGKRIFATTDHLGQHALWSIDPRSGKPTLFQSQGQVTDFSVGPQQVVFALAGLGAPADLHGINVDGGRSHRLTHFNAARLNSRMLGSFEQFNFAGWNGETVHGYVMKPAGFVEGGKYPIAFIVHGGPQVSYGNQWSYRWNPQVYAGAGYGVVFIDFHGSPGYGQAFTDSISGDWGGKPLEDLKIGFAAAVAKYSWLDGERACALGASYGGFMMNWIAGNWSDGFRCIVNHAGIFDNRGMYYQTEELWFEEWENDAPQFEKPENYEKHNPVNHVPSWRTPMLVTHGELDYRVPYAQGISAFTALQRRGIESRLLVFPDENHWVLKPHSSVQWHGEVLAWLDKWLKQ